MGFDIPAFQVDDDSPEGRALGRIISQEGVSPEEALQRSLRRAEGRKTPAEEMIGLFSSPEDLAIFESAMQSIKGSGNTWD